MRRKLVALGLAMIVAGVLSQAFRPPSAVAFLLGMILGWIAWTFA